MNIIATPFFSDCYLLLLSFLFVCEPPFFCKEDFDGALQRSCIGINTPITIVIMAKNKLY